MKKVEVDCALALRDQGSMTIAQLARVTGLSRPTVDAALTSLTALGLTVVDGSAGGGRDAGRPAKVYAFEAGYGHVAGIDVGGHHVRVLLADLGGRVVAYEEASLTPELRGSDTLETVFTLLDRVLEGPSSATKLIGIAVGVTGIVGADGRISLSWALPAWNSIDIAGRMHKRYDCPVVLENDARMASMAEHHVGASRLADNAVYLLVGHRLSSSLIIDGKVHRGRHHASGEAGYLLFDLDYRDDAGTIDWKTGSTAEDVVNRSLRGETDSVTELESFVHALAPGVAALSLVIDPDVVVIGGGLSRAGGVVISALQSAVHDAIRVPALPTLVQSELGSEAVVVGGLIRAYELAAEQLFGAIDRPAPDLQLGTILLPSNLDIPVPAPSSSPSSERNNHA